MILLPLRHRGLRAWLRTSLMVTLVAALALLASPASAHTTLVDAGPNSGDEVAPGGELVALKFGEELDTSGTLEVAVLDGDEEPVPVSDSQVSSTDGSIVCTRTAALGAGVHTVRYEVTADDGHVVRGNYQFTVTDGADGADAADDLGCDVSALAEPTEEKSLSDQDQSDFPAWAMWTIGAVVVLTAGLAVAAVLRSRRDQEDDADEGESSANE